MQYHIKTNCSDCRWLPLATILKASSLSLILILVLVSGSEAIVKQQQQQQRSDDLQQQQQQNSAYNNHKSSGSNSNGASTSSAVPSSSSSSSVASSSSSSSSSPSVSSSSNAQVPIISSQSSQQPQPSAQVVGSQNYNSQQSIVQQQPSLSSVNSQQQSVGGAGSRIDQMSANAYSNYAQPMQKSSYVDNMSAAASNPEQSYQAAANSVNMALANSGIFGPSSSSASGSSFANTPSSSGSQNVIGGGAGNSPSSANSQSALNPLHYFYYPAKDSSVGGSSSNNKQQQDMMSNAASNNNYQSAYPSYADQFNSALSMMNSAASPDAAASSQDPSYLPQPSMQQADNSQAQIYSQQPPMSNINTNTNNNNNNNNMMNQQQQIAPQQSAYNGDLGAYSSNLMVNQNQPPMQSIGGVQQQQQQAQQSQAGPSSVSFSGPTSSGVAGLSALSATSNDYMNPHTTNHNQQQQASGPMNAGFHSSLYNQLGDLSTSNFGNNAGGISSVASYMSPNQQDLASQSTNAANQHQQQQQQQAQQQAQAQHDFSSLLSQQGQQFNMAASQLSPASVARPNQMQTNSLLSAASSLFGTNNQQPQQQQQQQQAQNNMFASQQYLNSFLSPQQYGQLANGQQLNSLGAGDQLSAQASNSMGQQASLMPPMQTSASTSSGNGKRFGMGSLVMPMLALAGLSLLIPTFSNFQSVVGRKKRSLDERAYSRQQQVLSFNDYLPTLNGQNQMVKELSIGEYMDKIERYYSIYKDAVESDDCMNRLICEFGDAVKDVTGKSAVVTVIEKLVPTWMTGKVHLFKEAALNNKEGKEKCKKYICHSNKHQ